MTATSQISLNSTTGVDLNINPAIDSMKPDGSVWNAVHELGNDLDRMIYRRIDTNEAKSYAQFRIPANTTLVTLRGTVNLDHGNYSVTVDPPPPGSNSNGKTVLHGFATWSIPDMPLYVAPLDPGTSYTIRIENLDNKWFDLAGATFYTLNSADAQKAGQGASHGLSAGAIAGIVVGCVLGVLIIGALIGYCLWRRCYAHRYNRWGSGTARLTADPHRASSRITNALWSITPSRQRNIRWARRGVAQCRVSFDDRLSQS